MSYSEKHQILVVDNDSAVRDSLVMVLETSGYDVTSAIDGLDALKQLKTKRPALVLSDLNMPQMSGFEFLSVVRRRFPQISVIAMSGAYTLEEAVPSGLVADAFYFKGQGCPEALLQTVAHLIQTTEARTTDHARQSAPAWITRSGKDSHGIPYVILTCSDCLRSFSFSLSMTKEGVRTMQQTSCRFCSNTIRYFIDFSLPLASREPEMELPKLVPHLGHEFFCANAQSCSSRLKIDLIKMAATA
jgi:CheY-like chemotaxis protein